MQNYEGPSFLRRANPSCRISPKFVSTSTGNKVGKVLLFSEKVLVFMCVVLSVKHFYFGR